MGRSNSFEEVMYFTKCSVYLVCTWPPSRTATKWEIIKYDIAWFISVISALCLCIPIIFSIFVYRHDSLIVAQSVAFLSSFVSLFIKTFVFRVHRNRTQILIEEMENFLKYLQPHEKVVLQRYVDRCSYLHTFVSVVNYTIVSLMIITPLILPGQALPTKAIYPFNVDSGIRKYLVYIHQSVSSLQCAAGATIDCQAAIIMWFAGARLEILSEDLARVTDVSGFAHFVRKHKKLMSYAVEISDTMCYIALASLANCGIVAIMGAVQLLGNQPFAVQMNFGLAAMISMLILFISTWPAENLIEVCDELVNAVYNTSWIDMTPSMKKNLYIVLQRCQRPIIVSIGGFLPTLSLKSYISFLSGLLSYFTTIRAVMVSEN